MTPPLDLAALRALLKEAPALPYYHVIIDEDDDNLCIKHEHHDVFRVGDTPVNVACVLDSNGFTQLAVAAVNALPALLDRLERAERDAKRYRWIRAIWSPTAEVCFRRTSEGEIQMMCGDSLDAAIDAALTPTPEL